MANCSDNKNPLQRSGTSQLQRLLPGLSAGYVQVDENGFDNWIVFAAQFGRYIKYCDLTGKNTNTWGPFFNSDISALLGSIAVENIDLYKDGIKQRFDFLKENDNKAATLALKRNLSELFAAPLTLAQGMDRYLQKLTAYNYANAQESNSPYRIGLQLSLLNMVKSKLAPALKRLLGYYKAASTAPLNYVSGGGVSGWTILGMQVTASDSIISGNGLSKDWWFDTAASNWSDYVASISPDDSIFKSPTLPTVLMPIDGTDPDLAYERINHAANHNLFAAAFDQFLMAYSRFITEAEKELLKTLEEWDNHPPHYALFLAFLKLFRYAQSSLNTLTQRHLDYYYKEILQILPQSATPSQAHILIELAKQTAEWMLPENEPFKAGKDSAGKEILFALDKAETFNKAAVVAFKSIYLGTADDNHKAVTGAATINNNGRLFASSVTNSADGLGAALTSENKEWHPYVNKIFTEATLTDIAMPNAEIGFALASHYLYLTEGKRKVMLRFAAGTQNGTLATQLNGKIKCFLTAEKAWYEVAETITVKQATMENGTACAEISFTLQGNSPAILNYNAKVHGGTLGATTPVLKVVLKNDDTSAYNYSLLKDIVLQNVELKVEVGMETASWNQDGLKALHLSNDGGPLDAAKPFAPFGAQPKKDTTFVIGHKEAFCKKNAKIKLHLEWADLPAETKHIDYSAPTDNVTTFPNAKLHFLGGGAWARYNTPENAVPETVELFNGVVANVVVFSSPQKLPANVVKSYTEADGPYTADSKKGFLRLVLSKDFGYKKYLTDFSTYLINKANKVADTANPLPVEPYSPMLQSVYMSYTASVSINMQTVAATSSFTNREVQFFHLHPFGEAELHPNLLKQENVASTDVYVLPQFNNGQTSGDKIQHQGEFYIGLQNLQPLQSVSLLFQVLEGSADPELAKPETHVYWSYLGNNQWHNFETADISDNTRQLVQSGIISFAIPANAGTEHTVLPTGYIWLRASVENLAEAVCALLNVHAQAAPVTLLPNGNAPDVLSAALPADSIAKLKLPSASVKKVLQPYPSFGGKSEETESQFYVRVSERLRHKARAITIWDYEHLILQAFPQIHKAKCLNHTQMTKDGAVHYNEVKPGHVSIITIPSLVNRNDVNPLKPFTNQSLLLEIKEYLQQRISCHVQLEVANPLFEEVRIAFYLQLVAGYTDFTYYSNLLKQEITAYLTPWAYNNQVEVQFGGKAYKSSLINFIEERPYVEFITNVEMFHKIDGQAESANLEEISASTARSILVSAQASRHDIKPIEAIELTTTEECSSIKAK